MHLGGVGQAGTREQAALFRWNVEEDLQGKGSHPAYRLCDSFGKEGEITVGGCQRAWNMQLKSPCNRGLEGHGNLQQCHTGFLSSVCLA